MFGIDFDKFEAIKPLLEKKFKLKKMDLKTVDEFKTALQSLNVGATPQAERFAVEFEYEGRAAVGVLVLK